MRSPWAGEKAKPVRAYAALTEDPSTDAMLGGLQTPKLQLQEILRPLPISMHTFALICSYLHIDICNKRSHSKVIEYLDIVNWKGRICIGCLSYPLLSPIPEDFQRQSLPRNK